MSWASAWFTNTIGLKRPPHKAWECRTASRKESIGGRGWPYNAQRPVANIVRRRQRPSRHPRPRQPRRRARTRSEASRTPDRRADAGARRSARHGASAGIRVPMSIPIVISTVIGRVGEPVNMLIILVGVVPIGVVVGDRRVCPVGIHADAPASIRRTDCMRHRYFRQFGRWISWAPSRLRPQ